MMRGNGRRALATQAKAQAVSRVRGTRDLLPEEAEQHQLVVSLLQQTVARYGFRHVRLPGGQIPVVDGER